MFMKQYGPTVILGLTLFIKYICLFLVIAGLVQSFYWLYEDNYIELWKLMAYVIYFIQFSRHAQYLLTDNDRKRNES